MLGQNVLVAYGTVKIDEALARAAERAARGRTTVVVGIVRNPNAECWWVCLARHRAEIVWVSAHRLRRDADAQVAVVEQAFRRVSPADDAVFRKLVEELADQGDQEAGQTLEAAREIMRNTSQDGSLTERFQSARQRDVLNRADARKALAQRRRGAEAAR